MDAIIAWALAFMVSWAPPGRSKIKEAVETPEQGRERYAEIARAAQRVAFDPSVTPLFKGPHGRASTMALLLSVAWHESGFRRDVDLGVGKLARGSGTDSCLLQIRVGSRRTQEGWSHADLVSDREKCFRSGLALMRRSFGACHRLDQRDWLGVYTRGSCLENEPFSRNRMVLALKTPKAPVDDAAVINALAVPTGGATPSAVSSASP